MSTNSGSREGAPSSTDTDLSSAMRPNVADPEIERFRALAAEVVSRQLADREELTRDAEAARTDVVDLRRSVLRTDNE